MQKDFTLQSSLRTCLVPVLKFVWFIGMDILIVLMMIDSVAGRDLQGER